MNEVFSGDYESTVMTEGELERRTLKFTSCREFKDLNEMCYKLDIPNRCYPNEVSAYAECLIQRHKLKIKNKFDLYDKILDLMVEIEDAMKNKKLQERTKELEIKYEELIKSLNKK